MHRLAAAAAVTGLALLGSGAAQAQAMAPNSDYKLQLTPGQTSNALSNGRAVVGAAGFPKRKAGLWQVTTVGAQNAGLPPAMYCVDDNTDTEHHQLDRVSGDKGSCKIGGFKVDGATWVSEATCRDGKSVVTSRSVASGAFDHEYRIDTTVSYDPPLRSGRAEDRTASQATYIGPCKPGQKPGDMYIAGMGRINMVDGTVRASEAETPAPAKRPARAAKSAH